ncbi:hypothetical protein CASFOL_031718 [Castilleja foliolosa]|uniref:BAH domain-containing protein n=1 Tax=Castilleja foliolosa TaxID=1961234 RepID=A0ABD3C5H9_9LAMI
MAKTRPGSSKRDPDSYTIRGTTKVVKVGDCVLMRPSEVNSPPYVARIEKIESDNRNNVKVHVRWYYRPEEALGGRRPFHGAKELFVSDHYDMQSAYTIEGKCVIHTFKDYTKLENDISGLFQPIHCPLITAALLVEILNLSKITLSQFVASFFGVRILPNSRSSWDGVMPYLISPVKVLHMRKQGRFEYKPLPLELFRRIALQYCKCEMPYNPDDLMIQCEECKDWYHPECVDLTVEVVTHMDRFVCSDHEPDEDVNKTHVTPLANDKAEPKRQKK